MDKPTKRKLKRFFQGLKRKDAQRKQRGEKKATEGKQRMPWALYSWLCAYYINSDDIFAWAYLNPGLEPHEPDQQYCRHQFGTLVDRWRVTLGDHPSREEQSECAATAGLFALSDRILAGERDKEASHVYANPKNVAVCPITALGVWLLDRDGRGDRDETRLFPGGTL